jgi:DMSO/TMAO reductase YedYZ molybdopterin-dependent catalytic subunit
MKIRINDEVSGQAEFTIEQLTALAPHVVSLADRVPGVEGMAFELQEWYRAWQKQLQPQERADCEPSQMTVKAVDEFQATIPWHELGEAIFLYEQDGKPLAKGFPIRLYVPNGSSECLNVKSVIQIRFKYNEVHKEATYGFKNHISLEDLKFRK